MIQLGSVVWEDAERITDKVKGQNLMQVLQSDHVPHNPQPTCLSQALKASTRASVMPERTVVSATGLSEMPQDGHLVNVLHPGEHRWDELSAGFSMSPAGEKSKSQVRGL